MLGLIAQPKLLLFTHILTALIFIFSTNMLSITIFKVIHTTEILKVRLIPLWIHLQNKANFDPKVPMVSSLLQPFVEVYGSFQLCNVEIDDYLKG